MAGEIRPSQGSANDSQNRPVAALGKGPRAEVSKSAADLSQEIREIACQDGLSHPQP